MNRHTAETMPELPESEVRLLVTILAEHRRNGSCPPIAVGHSWETVSSLVSLSDRNMVRYRAGDIVLTPIGREWAEAFFSAAPS